MHLPPGPRYVLENSVNLLTPPALTFLSAKIYYALGFEAPLWVVVLLGCCSIPFAIFLRVWNKSTTDRRSAREYVATLSPRVYDKWPGGITLLAQMVDNLKNGYPGDIFVEWTVKYGPIWNMAALFEDRVFTSEPEYIQAILATQFHKFERGPVVYEQLKSMLGTGVFNSDGEMWRFHRAMTRPFFNKTRISNFEIFDQHATEALTQLKSRLREGYPVDIQDLASRFTMDCSTTFLLGKNVRSLGAGLPYPYYAAKTKTATPEHPANKFSKAFDEAQHAVALRARRGANWPLAEFWKDVVKEKMDIIHSFVNPIMQTAIERKTALGIASDNAGGFPEKVNIDDTRGMRIGDSLLDHLLLYTEDETILRDEIVNILLAGRDTTMNSITFSVYMLAEHPDVQQRLRKEILDIIGDSQCPTADDLKNMKYLRAVINETLRLYPSAPFILRTSSEPVILPSKNGNKPFFIPARSKVLADLLLLHRRRDLWGPDALEFDPDRFLDQRLKTYLGANPLIFLPFSAGPRICLGQQIPQFAYNEISFFLVRLLQKFSSISHDFEAQPPDLRPPTAWSGAEGPKGRDKIRMNSYMTMSAMGGCWIRLEA
ncbi:cytochrome P450 monooxygenase pc-3 [Gymnopilus junonius]|uniref:Cytochrome P450 monooxygenase pc-3 n=1 Tax=Gymnopilus junonius TaxID=109634 RepID=A0A9P5NKS9_GYMJU|nr:cytochrome P450 monooxygenase pc-3 [Gymnopilus junonius]